MNPYLLFGLGALGGAPLIVVGLWMLRSGRVYDPEQSRRREELGLQPKARMSQVTRTVVALCLLIVGYHLAAYTAPDAWNLLRVPIERWWLLAIGVTAAIAGSFATDRFERSRM